MKARYTFFIFIILINFIWGCKKLVTDLPPKDRLDAELAFTTPERMEKAVLSVYNALQSNQKDGNDDSRFLSGEALVLVDVFAEDVIDIRGRLSEISRFTILSNSDISEGVWSAGYTAIATANRVIEGVQANPTVVSAAKTNQFIAEAKFGRAIAHFYLVNFFGQPYSTNPNGLGIPIITQAFTKNDPAANKPRNTVAEVYTQIIQDLTEALADLPLSYGDAYSDKARATKAAAAALLSRVYLYKQDYANVKLYAGKIINGDYGVYALNASPEQCFGPGNYQTDESIFSIPNSKSPNNENPGINFGLNRYIENVSNDLGVSPTFLNTATNPYFALDDKRRTLLIVNNTKSDNAGLKFTGKYSDEDGRADWAPVIRYAEVLLTYAEASAQISGINVDALAKLNMVRDRSRVAATRYTIASFADKTAFINAILGERRIELAFEGHRLWDLRRYGKQVINKFEGNGTIPVPTPADTKYVLPIPAQEVQKSGGVLVPNP